jgi:hypothetical protein
VPDSTTTSTPSRRALLVRLTESDYQAVADAAESDDISKADVVRSLVHRHFGIGAGAVGSQAVGNL